jgi:hypothetical protein
LKGDVAGISAAKPVEGPLSLGALTDDTLMAQAPLHL